MVEIWDVVGGGLLGKYESVAESLAVLREYLSDEGSEYVAGMALCDQSVGLALIGDALVDYLRALG